MLYNTYNTHNRTQSIKQQTTDKENQTPRTTESEHKMNKPPHETDREADNK